PDRGFSARPPDWAPSSPAGRIIAAVSARAGRGSAWASWVVVSVIGGVLGALVAWRVRALITFSAPALVVDALRYIATIASAAVTAGAQWILLRRYRLDVFWWVPATVIAALLTAIVVSPSVLSHAGDPLGAVHPSDPLIAGGAALADAGFVLGTADAMVVRPAVGNTVRALMSSLAIALTE